MGKRNIINELTTLLSLYIVHKIGSLVNIGDIYASKYEREGENFLKKARKIAPGYNWNIYERILIKEKLTEKIKTELTKRDFLNERKFDISKSLRLPHLKRCGLFWDFGMLKILTPS